LFSFLLLTFAFLLAGALAPRVRAQDVKDGGPYVPTPQAVVDAMLDVAKVGPRDFVADLGSGDGRIVLTAAQKRGARGFGVDIDEDLVEQANAAARRLGLSDRVRFLKQDVRAADLGKVTVLTLYLLPGMMTTLRAKILAELPPGARIVSHDFEFGEWKPDRTIEIDTPEKYETLGAWTSVIHLWIAPARVEGSWQGVLPGPAATRFRLDLRQEYQRFEGKLVQGGREHRVRNGRIEGTRVQFSVPRVDGPGSDLYSATVNGDGMTGEIRGTGAEPLQWNAARPAPAGHDK
jgi:hypothetical protein